MSGQSHQLRKLLSFQISRYCVDTYFHWSDLTGKAFGAGYSNEFFELDLDLMQWTNLSGKTYGPSPQPRAEHGFSYGEGNLWLFGGVGSNGELFLFWVISFSKSDFCAQSQTKVLNNSFLFEIFFLFTHKCGSFFAINVDVSPGYLSDLYTLNLNSFAWNDLTSIWKGTAPTARVGGCFMYYSERLFVFGGYDDSSKTPWFDLHPAAWFWHTWQDFSDSPLNDFYYYEISMLLWTRMTNDETGTPPFNRWFAGIAALQNKLYVYGGSTFNQGRLTWVCG